MRSRAAEIAARVSLVAMGVFTAVPALALVRPDQLESSYGVTDPDPMLLTLLQHRGMLQLLAGAALIWAAVRPGVRIPVAVGLVVAKTTALLLTATRPEAQAQASAFIQGFDVVCVVVLLAIIAGTLRSSHVAASPVAAQVSGSS
jgi:hypothetical protein